MTSGMGSDDMSPSDHWSNSGFSKTSAPPASFAVFESPPASPTTHLKYRTTQPSSLTMTSPPTEGQAPPEKERAQLFQQSINTVSSLLRQAFQVDETTYNSRADTRNPGTKAANNTTTSGWLHTETNTFWAEMKRHIDSIRASSTDLGSTRTPADRRTVYATAIALCNAQESLEKQEEQLSMNTLNRTSQDGQDGSTGGEGDDDGPQKTKLQAIVTAREEFLRLENALVLNWSIGNLAPPELPTRFIFPKHPFNSRDLLPDQTTVTAETGSKRVPSTR